MKTLNFKYIYDNNEITKDSMGSMVVFSLKDIIAFNLEWCIHIGLFSYLNYQVSVIRLQLICSVLRASKFSVLKLTKFVILWVYYTISFGFSLIWPFWGITFRLLNYFVWLRITDESSVPEMHIMVHTIN